ncbi:hypothetical protein [Victivallis sp. Marseille-Q1083]|uniref:hypothetical protein n=1 Tax=Victivallis sp. Marseille-Q1083 TaxID=2717288 RepID=UPI00158DC8BD|nr:hypothetical protein [Victivallis sp. Marseille-Q1083]
MSGGIIDSCKPGIFAGPNELERLAGIQRKLTLVGVAERRHASLYFESRMVPAHTLVDVPMDKLRRLLGSDYPELDKLNDRQIASVCALLANSCNDLKYRLGEAVLECPGLADAERSVVYLAIINA